MSEPHKANLLDDRLLKDSCRIIDDAQQSAYYAINVALIKRNWLLGMRIHVDVLNEKRADYGASVVKRLGKELSKRYGDGFTRSNLYNYLAFFQQNPEIFHAVRGLFEKSGQKQKVHAVRGLFGGLKQSENQKDNNVSEIAIQMLTIFEFSGQNVLELISPATAIKLTWTHYRILLQVTDDEARQWYADEAARETWSTRTLQRNVSSQYYRRLLMSQHKELVREEMLAKTTPLADSREFIKNPVIAEFLGLSQRADFTESELEGSIIDNLQKFLMELGKGYAFVARQYHVRTEKEDYYIDLVFYNYLMQRFVLIDLKTAKVTHQDVGQMDMYVRMFDEQHRAEGHQPTLGILLCADTDEDIARYSVLHDSEQLFATKLAPYLPTKEQLRAEIEAQKRIYYQQQADRQEGLTAREPALWEDSEVVELRQQIIRLINGCYRADEAMLTALLSDVRRVLGYTEN